MKLPRSVPEITTTCRMKCILRFSDPIFFIFIFAAFAIQTKFSFSCDGITVLNHDGLEETEHIRIALRDFAKSLRELKNIFVQNRFFTFIVESIVSFISFSKGPWELNKTMCFITYSLKTWFIMTRSKQNWSLKWKKKSLLFLPASACRRDRVWFAFIWWHFPDRRVSGKTPRMDHTWQNPQRLS